MSKLQTTVLKHPVSTVDNITLETDGSFTVGKAVVGPRKILFADDAGKVPLQADKVIVSTLDPDPNQGDENWIWYKV
jgi:hypothetical protein